LHGKTAEKENLVEELKEIPSNYAFQEQFTVSLLLSCMISRCETIAVSHLKLV